MGEGSLDTAMVLSRWVWRRLPVRASSFFWTSAPTVDSAPWYQSAERHQSLGHGLTNAEAFDKSRRPQRKR